MYGVFYVLLVGNLFSSLYGIIEWLIIIFVRAKKENVRKLAITLRTSGRLILKQFDFV